MPKYSWFEKILGVLTVGWYFRKHPLWRASSVLTRTVPSDGLVTEVNIRTDITPSRESD